jgi:hypothetical protein
VLAGPILMAFILGWVARRSESRGAAWMWGLADSGPRLEHDDLEISQLNLVDTVVAEPLLRIGFLTLFHFLTPRPSRFDPFFLAAVISKFIFNRRLFCSRAAARRVGLVSPIGL